MIRRDDWTGDQVYEALKAAYAVLLRTPVLSPAKGALKPALSPDEDVLAPLEWTVTFLGYASEERKFIIRHLGWLAAGVSVRGMVEGRAPIWERRAVSWATYNRLRAGICDRIAAGLNAAAAPPLTATPKCADPSNQR